MPKTRRPVNTDQPVLSVIEVADLLGIPKSNVRATLERAGIEPYAELALGPIWRRQAIVRLRDKRAKDEVKAAANEARRQALLRHHEALRSG